MAWTGYSLKAIADRFREGIYQKSETYSKDEVYSKTESYSNTEVYPKASTFSKDEVTKAIGNINSPLLDLPLKNNLAMKAGVGSTTFSRASGATYMNRYGRLSYASTDEARFEKEGLLIEGASTNKSIYSKTPIKWSVSPSVSLVSTTVLSPDGTATAGKFIWDSGYKGSQAVTSGSVSFTDGVTETRSIFVKPEGFEWARIQTDVGIVGICFFDLVNGVVGTAIECTGSIEKIGDYYKLGITVTPSLTGSASLSIYQADYDNDYATTGDGVKGYSLWGAQIEELPFASSYIPSTDTFTSRATTGTYYDATGTLQTASIDEARYTYNPSDLTAPSSLLLEDASTNLLQYSEVFNASIWTKIGAVITANASSAPDGNTTADGFDNTLTIEDRAVQLVANTGVNTYTFSVWIKAGANRTLAIELTEQGGTAFSNIVNCSVTSEWQRFTITGTTNSDNTGVYAVIGRNSSDQASDYRIWGAQLEQSTFPSSYIHTTTTAVTRSADVSTSVATTRASDITTSTHYDNFPSGSSGTIIMDVAVFDSSATKYLLSVYEDATNYFYIRLLSTGQINVASEYENTVKIGLGSTVSLVVGTKYRIGVTFDETGSTLYLDGVQVDTDTHTGLTFSQLLNSIPVTIGGLSGNSSSNRDGNYSSIRFYDKALTAEEMRLA